MIKFKSIILKFGKKGEKSGWTYLEIPSVLAEKLNPGCKKSFRVKGFVDKCEIKGVALWPMGKGDFIMPLNSRIRKFIGKKINDPVFAQLEFDPQLLIVNKDLMTCLKEEPAALHFFKSLPRSQQNYFSVWISEAKTENTKAKRIAQSINALLESRDYVAMVRYQKGLS